MIHATIDELRDELEDAEEQVRHRQYQLAKAMAWAQWLWAEIQEIEAETQIEAVRAATSADGP